MARGVTACVPKYRALRSLCAAGSRTVATSARSSRAHRAERVNDFETADLPI
jgi:hypothetical protein